MNSLWQSRLKRIAIPAVVTLAVFAQFPATRTAVALNCYCSAPEEEETTADKSIKTTTAVVFAGGIFQFVQHPSNLFKKPSETPSPVPSPSPTTTR